ncbi:MAG: PKD domain-containing protein, partial [Gammaproteobacteria bacterium]|nr:PKD domain-containing protein [Gammaproteobacteria bacterium]
MNIKPSWLFLLAIVPILFGCDSSGSKTATPALANNQAPIAIAGINQNVKTGSVVKLDGLRSVDKDRDLITYQWVFKSKPQGSEANLQASTT